MSDLLEIKSFDIRSQAMLDVYKEVRAFARHKQGFIVFGQTGSGKELLARHYYTLLKELHPEIKKFISLNCATFSPEMIISELFGHVQGAFTGATQHKTGIFEEAENCVLFLDEIGDLHPDAHPKLLRALDPNIREGKKLGSNDSYTIKDIIVISATDKRPEDLKDSLLYRLGFQINIPPLDDRQEDIFPATQFFIYEAFNKRRDKEEIFEKLFPGILKVYSVEDQSKFLELLAKQVADDILPNIRERKWPGNFRNLRIVLDYAMIQIDSFSDRIDFIQKYIRIFLHALDKYSVRNDKYSELKSTSATITPTEKVEDKELEDLCHHIKKILSTKEDSEIRRIAEFLKKSDHYGFKSDELCRYVGYNTTRTAQSRIKELVNGGILSKSDRPRARYFFGKSDMPMAVAEYTENAQFRLPAKDESFKVPAEAMAGIVQSIENGYGIHLNAEEDVSYGNKYLIELGHLLKEKFQLFYYSFESGSPEDLTDKISDLIQFKVIAQTALTESQPIDLRIAVLSGYLHHYFNDHKPVLLLNHFESLQDSKAKSAVYEIIHYWNAFSIIISGRKMDIRNQLLTEYPL